MDSDTNSNLLIIQMVFSAISKKQKEKARVRDSLFVALEGLQHRLLPVAHLLHANTDEDAGGNCANDQHRSRGSDIDVQTGSITGHDFLS